ncbi:MAG: MarR family transcriptional regulator [Opitutae bacterium]|nr:MarR family transcriptional regulator [Opitutae bacterium]
MSATAAQFDRRFGFLIGDISRLLRREFDRRVRGLGLTRAQWLLIVHASRTEGATLSELADNMQHQKITVSRLAARLERAGWLERRDDPADGRAYRVFLRPRARKTLTRLNELADALRDDLFAGLTPARREALLDDLQHVKGNLLALEARAKSQLST